MKIKFNFGQNLSLITVFGLVVAAAITALCCFSPNVLSWDTFGYYLYLPQLFIYNDLGIQDTQHLQEIVDKYESTATLYQIWQTDTGHWLIRYTAGQAVLFAPFFLIAHAYVLLTGGVADGFSLPYQVAIAVGCFLYFIAAMFLLRSILRNFFSEKITALTLCLLFLGTNLFANTIFSIAGIHAQLFFLYTVLIYFTIRWHQRPSWLNLLPIAVSAGLIILTRPTDIICLLIPVLWNAQRPWREFFGKFTQHWLQILTCGIIIGLIGSIQLLYWKFYADHWILDSYNNPGEGMDFFHPHIKQTLVSFRKGWFVYTPMMMLMLLGFIGAFRRGKECALACLVFLLCNIYLVSCWSCWWYAGSFSQRAYVQSYALLALPLGFLVQSVMEWQKGFRIPAMVVFALLCVLNLFQTWQYEKRIIDPELMTKEAYFANFFQTDKAKCNPGLLLIQRDASGVEVMDSTRNYVEHFIRAKNYKNDEGRTDSTKEFTEALRIPYYDLSPTDHAWTRVAFTIMPTVPVSENPGLLVATFQHKEGNYKYRTFPLPDTLKPNEWNTVTINYLTPPIRCSDDELCLYYWHQGKQPVYVQKIEVWASDIRK